MVKNSPLGVQLNILGARPQGWKILLGGALAQAGFCKNIMEIAGEFAGEGMPSIRE